MAFNRYFESKEVDEIPSTEKKHPNIDDDDSSTVIDKYLEYIRVKGKKYQTLFIGKEIDSHKLDLKMEDFIDKNLVSL